MERHWHYEHGEWWSETPVGEGQVPIPDLRLDLTLREIYDDLDLSAVSEPETEECGGVRVRH